MSFVIISICENELLPLPRNFSRMLVSAGSLPHFAPVLPHLQVLGCPRTCPLTSSHSTFCLGDLVGSSGTKPAFRIMTPSLRFAALTAPLNSCHCYPAAYWTSSLPILTPTRLYLHVPKAERLFPPNFSPFSIFSISVHGYLILSAAQAPNLAIIFDFFLSFTPYI